VTALAAKLLMVQGTSSSVGKSLLVAGLCRLLHQEGYRVAPFKAQNMALNAAVTPDGLEIGRAQAVQAEAAGIEPCVEMNPILLKPEGDSRCQVVVMGKPQSTLHAQEYYRQRDQLWETVRSSLERLRSRFDLVLIEGAGSPAEVNLRKGDLVNMRVALETHSPVLLAGDIDKGGVFASLIGTLELLAPEERELVKGFVINKFRGDVSLLEPGLRFLEGRTGIPVLGVVPYIRGLLISQEDSAGLEEVATGTGLLDVAVIRLPRIANFDDFDLLGAEQAVGLRFVGRAEELRRPDLVILPGSKGTVSDLGFLRETGLDRAITALARTGTPILGICGGYQMMGERILDPDGVESAQSETAGLGLLPATTTFAAGKRTVRVRAKVKAEEGPFASARGASIDAYEIHMGGTLHTGGPIFELAEDGKPVSDGCIAGNGLLMGSYLHGLFENESLRRALVDWLVERRGLPPLHHTQTVASRDAEYDRLAETLRQSLDLVALRRIIGLEG
jgi:adenosylcobyric acid synthase